MMILLLAMAGCELPVTIGAECLAITEVVTSPTDFVFDPVACELREAPGDTGFRPDWVELCNVADVEVDAGAYTLFSAPTDNPYARPRWPLPEVTVDPGECLVVIADPDLYGLCPLVADFDLDQEVGADLRLGAGHGACADDVQFERLRVGTSYALTEGGWQRGSEPDPGHAELP